MLHLRRAALASILILPVLGSPARCDDKKNVVWGSKRNVVWGSSTTEGFNTIWESSVNQSDGTNFAPESLGLLINGEN